MIGGHDVRLLPTAVVVWGVSAWLTTRGSTPSVVVAATAVVLAGAVVTRWRPLALVLGCLTVVAVSCAWRTAVAESSPLNDLAERHRSGTFELSVSRDAIAFDQRGAPQAVVQVTIRQAEVAGQRIADAGRATAFVEGDAADLVVGRHFTAVARLSPSDHSREVAVLDVTRRGDVSAGATWWEGAERLRQGMRDASEPLPPRPRALLPALVNGDDARVDAEMETEFQRSGLTHLMAVSGTNLTIVLGVMLALVRGVGLGRRSVLWVIGGLTVAAFVLMARPDPSVVRAAAMGIVGVAALGFGRSGGMRALSLAVIALLFIDPWIGRSPGFVLSVCATAGILLLAPPLADRLGQWMQRWAALAVAIPIAAQLACTPALTAISGQVSAVSVIANVLAAPAVAPATVLGLAAGLVAVPLPVAGQLIAQPAGWCAAWIVAVARHSAGLDGASVPWSAPWQLMLVLAPVATVLVLALASRPVLAAGVVLGLVAATVRPPSPGWPPQGWVMVACDVGQGDGTVLRAGPSTAVLVDVGPDPTAIDGCLDRLGVDHIALAIFTHSHADHTAGWSGARRGRAVDRVAVGPSGGPEVQDSGALHLQAGATFSVGDVQAEIVWPADTEALPAGADGSTFNDASIVLRVQVRGVALLITGDIEPEAQDAIVRSGVPLAADVLKVPHHGSARQSRQFFEAVDARIATISSGEDNDYGHPAGAALALLRDGDTQVWRTDQDGDVAVVVREGQMRVVTQR
ncbi:ComEC/Rec2 family competence protein [Aeromicrobium sp. CF3.5]|uniref:ComEC/Rec2 family competence protein n=1 Tax=Aeromicrobium sp. CF3.5 TaxID=3373078 RepID=UPI003EE657E9